MTKKWIALLLVCIIGFITVGCQKSKDDKKDDAISTDSNTASLSSGSSNRLAKIICTEPDGNKTETTPEISGNRITITAEFDGEKSISVYEYYPDGNAPVRVKQQHDFIDEYGYVTLDDALHIGNPISYTNENGTTGNEFTYEDNVMKNVYLENGELVKTEVSYFEDNGYEIYFQVFDEDDPSLSPSEKNIFEYNESGKVIKITSYNDITFEFEYDSTGSLLKATRHDSDYRQEEAVYTYDSDNHVVKLNYTLTSYGDIAGEKEYTYEYDSLGRLVKFASADGSVTEYFYE